MSEEDPKAISQPAIKRGRQPGVPQFPAGGKRSVAILRELKFDPIRTLVSRYQELEKEVEYWKLIRSRKLIEIVDSKGKERYYDSDAHMAAESADRVRQGLCGAGLFSQPCRACTVRNALK